MTPSETESEETSVMKWKRIKPSADKSPASLSFTSDTGVPIPLPANPSPTDVFSHFFDTTLLELLVTETNRLVHSCVECTSNEERK